MIFVEFWRYFNVIFEALSDKREMKLRRTNNVDDEEESMHLDWDFKVVQVESEKGNGRNDKRKLKNQIYSFRMTM